MLNHHKLPIYCNTI